MPEPTCDPVEPCQPRPPEDRPSYSWQDERDACARAYGFAAETVYEVSERTTACCLIRMGRPSGLPKELDAKLRAELAALWAVPV